MRNLLFLLLTAFSISAAAQSNEWEEVGIHNTVRSIATDGPNLWLATDDGLLKYDKQTGVQTLYNSDNSGLITNYLEGVSCIGGDVWMGTYHRGAARFDGQKIVSYTKLGEEDIFSEHQGICGIVADAGGNIWFGGMYGLFRYDGRNWEWNPIPDSFHLAHLQVSFIAFDSDSTLWFGCIGSMQNPLGRITRDGKMEIIQSVGHADIDKIAVDKAGNVWYSTHRNGIARFDGTNVERFTSQNSPLPTDFTCGLTIDDENNIWFGCGSDLYKYDGKQFTAYELPTEKFVSDLHIDGDTIWVGTFGDGMFRLVNGQINNIRLIDTPTDDDPAAILPITVSGGQTATSAYDLQGRKINAQSTMNRSAEGRLLPTGRKNAQLKKGIYIQNGRKRVVK